MNFKIEFDKNSINGKYYKFYQTDPKSEVFFDNFINDALKYQS